METSSFDEWLRFVFDRPVAASIDQQWWQGLNEENVYWTGSPEVLRSFVIQLFEEPQLVFSRFSEDQIGQGLWFMIFVDGCSDYMTVLLRQEPEVSQRVRCVEAMYSLFAKGFAPRCSGIPAFRRREGQGSKLDTTCYMWWDIINDGNRSGDLFASEVNDAALDVMRRLLRASSVNVQESALHGLKHWQECYPDRATAIVDDAIASDTLDARLIPYARGQHQ